ncbi:MAG: thiamine diphosphokinase [Phocaeicola sp.]
MKHSINKNPLNLPFGPFEAVVLAQGEYPTHTIPATLLQNSKFIVCCDGAANELVAKGIIPHAIVGDGDSLSPAIRTAYEQLLHLECEQESNDLTKSIRYLLKEGQKRVAIVGGTGKREDHTLGNISLLLEYQQMGMEVVMYTNYGYLVACQDEATFSTVAGQQLSIFNFGAKEFQAEGLKYPIYDFSSWWQGTLNECTGSEVVIEAKGHYLLFFTYPAL